MNNIETDRYLRHSLIDWFSQERVYNSRIGVVGAGAIGNEVVKNLVLLGVGHIDVYDFDYVEVHNLTRSILLRESDIGKSKAKCVVERASQLDPNIELRAFVGDFWDNMSLFKMKNYNAVICCVDNYEARIRLNQLCLLAGVNLINSGIDSRYVSIEYYPFSRGMHIPCYECNLPGSAYQQIATRYSCGWVKKKALAEKAIPTTIITSSIAGAHAASIAISGCCLGKEELEGTRVLIDTKTFNTTISRLLKNKACGGCSHYDTRPVVIKTKRIVDVLYPEDYLDMTFILSDQIIVDYQCAKGCNVNKYRTLSLYRRTRDFDDSVFVCPECRSKSIDLKIKDIFQGCEIANILIHKNIPVKYILAFIKKRIICFELEEGKDG